MNSLPGASEPSTDAPSQADALLQVQPSRPSHHSNGIAHLLQLLDSFIHLRGNFLYVVVDAVHYSALRGRRAEGDGDGESGVGGNAGRWGGGARGKGGTGKGVGVGF